MGEFAEVLVPVSFEVAELESKQSGQAVEVGPEAFVQISPSTADAIELAARLAAGGRLRLVHATPDLTHFGAYGGPEGAWFPTDTAGEFHRIAKEHSLLVLRALASRHAPGMECEFYVAPGSPISVILHAVDTKAPDAVVLAASGRGRVRRMVLGSTANKLMRQATCPVIVMPRPLGNSTVEASL